MEPSLNEKYRRAQARLSTAQGRLDRETLRHGSSMRDKPYVMKRVADAEARVAAVQQELDALSEQIAIEDARNAISPEAEFEAVMAQTIARFIERHVAEHEGSELTQTADLIEHLREIAKDLDPFTTADLLERS